MTQPNIEEIRQRAARYPYEDGMIEIGHGSVYAVLGLLIWVADIIISGGEGKWIFALGVMAFSLLAAVVLGAVVQRYKENVTYPRTGKVEYQRSPQQEARQSLALIGVALALAAAAIFLDGWYASTTVIVGAAITMILYFAGHRASLTRMKVLAFVPLVIALLASYYGMDVTIGSGLAIGGSGLVTLASGLIAMRGYLANNPAPDDEES